MFKVGDKIRVNVRTPSFGYFVRSFVQNGREWVVLSFELNNPDIKSTFEVWASDCEKA